VGSGRTPPRPDLGAGPAPVRPGPDPTLLTVVAISVVALVVAVILAVAPPRPTSLHDRSTAAASPTPSASPTPTRGASGANAAKVPTGPNGPFSFLAATLVDGKRVPVRWNPCQPIGYQLEFEAHVPGARAAIQAAIEQTSLATDIPFRFDGRSTVNPRSVFKGGFFSNALGTVYRPVLITLVTDETFQSFAPSKRAVAFAHPERGTQLLDHQYVSGVVVIDGGVHYPSSGRWSLALVVQHELGHLMGLGHVRAPDELMFSFETAPQTIPTPISGWGPGDRRGLARLGADQGCLQPVRVRG
jgi:hypothetical protein